jgi:hypothetical protein
MSGDVVVDHEVGTNPPGAVQDLACSFVRVETVRSDRLADRRGAL